MLLCSYNKQVILKQKSGQIRLHNNFYRPVQFLLMNFQVLKQYFSFLAEAESKLQLSRQSLQLSKNSCSSLYHLIATRSQPEIDAQLLANFIRNFTYNFQERPISALLNEINYQLVPEQNSSQQALMTRGIHLFLERWSSNGKVTFAEFTKFIKGEEDQPQKAKEVTFAIKKKLYETIEEQIQHLLDGETLRKTVSLTYRNKEDLFQMLSHNQQITIQEVKNLFLSSGDRKDQEFLDRLSARFILPCDYTQFRNWFSVTPSANKYKQQTRIFYSSIKGKKSGREDDHFNTPSGKTPALIASSTKMTKGDRLHSIQLDKPQLSRFTFENALSSRTSSAVLGDILLQEQRLNELKRQLIYREDYDLELIYERKGKLFEQMLNSRYGTCNFTSFVRYIIPQDFEQRYLAFIKYQRQNQISAETQALIDDLLEQEHIKQTNIKERWNNIDREVVFRSYCNPGLQKIANGQMKKYFTQRQCKILSDRLDPHKTGFISYDNFH